MKRSVTAREAQHGLGRLLSRVERGERVAITRRGKVVAQLVPPARPTRKLEWPDMEARMRRIFPDGPPKGKPASQLIEEDREERF